MQSALSKFSLRHPVFVVILIVILTIILGAMIPRIKIDTDPENMLSEHDFVRTFHDAVKKEFSLYDMIVLGIVDETNKNGIFSPSALSNIFNLTERIKKIDGVIVPELMSLSTMENIVQAGPGTISFEWLMKKPPETEDRALYIRDAVMDNPLLKGTLVSETGKAAAIYIPIKKKDMSYRIAGEIRDYLKTLKGAEKYYITGLPVAEDTFGVEMFKQMAISAPLAGLIIFLLMLFFFRKLSLIISPMLVAVISIIWTMGLLIGMGFTVHIMSSMIPIFLMPIAVVDSVHILSVFFDRYQKYKDRKKTMLAVIDELFMPMLYTSLTSAVGFASLAFTPIPPVRIFGLFVAFGIMSAWILTIMFIPAYVAFIKDETLKRFGTVSHAEKPNILTRILHKCSSITFNKAKLVIVITLIIIIISIVGIRMININDNPVKWFVKSHPIREADRVMNSHFGGTYEAFMVLEKIEDKQTELNFFNNLKKEISEKLKETGLESPGHNKYRTGFFEYMNAEISKITDKYKVRDVIEVLKNKTDKDIESSDDAASEAADEISYILEDSSVKLQLFKQPPMLSYIGKFQKYLIDNSIVGKTNSLADIVKKIYSELYEGKKEYYRIPDTAMAVGQCLFQLQSSNRPDDVWHMVTQDYNKLNIWFQLRNGDNQTMSEVVKKVNNYFIKNPPPYKVKVSWAGLTYLNVVWQDKMVGGMLKSLLGSFIIVLIMMIFLFRSILWGVLSMLPLTVTITLIYGLIGIFGKDYDMPVAVLSSLTLGLSIDFAIHFIERAKELFKEKQSWQETNAAMFGAPARAISRNLFVIAIGFLPLLAAPLVPYKTVGFFLASIMAVSGAATLLILPSLITVLRNPLFKIHDKVQPICLCGLNAVIMIVVIGTVSVLLYKYSIVNWSTASWIGAAGVLIAFIICMIIRRSAMCRVEKKDKK